MQELLIEFLSKTLNMDKESVISKLFKKDDATGDLSLNDNALPEMLTLDADRVKRLKEQQPPSDALDNQYKRGKKEALEALEATLKKKYDIEIDKTGVELVDALVSKVQGAKLDDDKVKMHPLVLDLQDKLKKQLEETTATYEERIKGIESDYKRKDTFNTVSAKIKDLFDAQKPILPSDAAKAAFLRDEFANRFSDYDFEVLENGKVLPTRNGKRLEDAHANPIYLDSLVRDEVGRRFDTQQQSDKGSAGNQNGQTPPMSVPKTADEYEKALFNAKTGDERIALADAFAATQK